MRNRVFIVVLAFLMMMPALANAKDKNKKKQSNRGMLESMQSVPCGAKERGFTGIGALFGSIGVQHTQSEEKLCPQYLFRTDEMDYHIRPLDLKHAGLLPVGEEGVYKIKKNLLFLRMGDKKTRPYRVISMQPNRPQTTGTTSYAPVHPQVAPATEHQRPENPPNRQAANQAGNPPPQ